MEVRSITKNKKPKSVYTTSQDYDFLRHIRVVMRWATHNYEIGRPQVEVLLYLYPLGTFTRSQFKSFYRVIGINHSLMLQEYIRDGWIVQWRPRKRNQRELFTLSTRAKGMCSRMHKMCLGELPIPEESRSNKLVQSDKRIDGYYMDIIRDMNKQRDKALKKDDK